MPAEISNLEDDKHKVQALVFPNHIAGIAIYDHEEDTDGVIVVACDKHDTASDIFLFPTPDGFTRQENPNELMEYCNEDTFITQIEHGEECHIETGSRAGNVIEFVISHSFIMSGN